MPIDKTLFNLAKDPSPLILQFLEKNPNQAFNIEEIYKSIEEFGKLDIPMRKVKDTLDYLVDSGKIEIAWLQNEVYYSIKEEEEF